jgi:phosphate transport system protein
MASHRQEFDRELEAIEAEVIELFAMVAEDLPSATNALLNSSSQALGILAEREQAIHALYPQIEKLAGREILLQAPVADDLRFLLSVLGILPDLERSHHSVVEIASRASHILGQDLSPRTRGLIEQMGNLVSGMWRQAADCWYQRDRSAAGALAERELEMDELHASLIAELASARMTPPETMEMALVARCYQRLGDHAVNIARRVVYLAGTAPGQRYGSEGPSILGS